MLFQYVLDNLIIGANVYDIDILWHIGKLWVLHTQPCPSFTHELVDSVNVEIVVIVAVVIAVAEAIIFSSVIVLFSIAVDVVRFISLTILVPPGYPGISHQSSESNEDVDKVVDKTTAGERRRGIP